MKWLSGKRVLVNAGVGQSGWIDLRRIPPFVSVFARPRAESSRGTCGPSPVRDTSFARETRSGGFMATPCRAAAIDERSHARCSRASRFGGRKDWEHGSIELLEPVPDDDGAAERVPHDLGRPLRLGFRTGQKAEGISREPVAQLAREPTRLALTAVRRAANADCNPALDLGQRVSDDDDPARFRRARAGRARSVRLIWTVVHDREAGSERLVNGFVLRTPAIQTRTSSRGHEMMLRPRSRAACCMGDVQAHSPRGMAFAVSAVRTSAPSHRTGSPPAPAFGHGMPLTTGWRPSARRACNSARRLRSPTISSRAANREARPGALVAWCAHLVADGAARHLDGSQRP
jgi:hypothetical protein